MIMNATKKLSIFLLVLIHVPLCAMTEKQIVITKRQAGMVTGLMTVGMGCLACKSDNFNITASSTLVTAALSYAWLSQYTPQAKLRNAKAILDSVVQNKLAKSFNEIDLEIDKEIVQQYSIISVEDTRHKGLFDAKLTERITELYPSIPDVAPYPLVTAINNLVPVEADIKKACNMLDAVGPCIDPVKDKELWDAYSIESKRAHNLQNNATKAHSKISLIPAYKKDEQDFRNWQDMQKNTAIKKQKVELDKEKAEALQQQSRSVRSYVRLEHIKWLFGSQGGITCLSIIALACWCLSR